MGTQHGEGRNSIFSRLNNYLVDYVFDVFDVFDGEGKVSIQQGEG